jgi:PST family polysaccharide transporter
VRWVALGQALGQLLRFLVSVVLARLLVPEDFGLLAMAAVFSELVGMFYFLGAGAAIIQRPVLSEPLRRVLVTLGVLSGLSMTIVLVALSPLIAAYFGDPRVQAVAAVSALGFLLQSFGLVPDSLLQRELNFRRLVAIALSSQVVRAAVALSLAALGWGVWSLVVATLVHSGLQSVLLLISSPWPVRAGFGFKELREVIGFSAGVLGFNFTQYFARNTDNLIIGRALGTEALGYYSYAYRIYMYPLTSITNVLMRVMFPALSRLQEDDERAGAVFLRANSAIAIITFPIMAGLAAVADVFVDAVLGEKWRPIVALILVLAPVGMMQSVTGTTGQMMLAKGRSGLRFWWSVVYSGLMVISFFCGLPWGVVGVATAYAIVNVPVSYISFRIALGIVHHPMSGLWRALSAPTSASAIMFGSVWAAKSGLLATGLSAWPTLLFCVPLGIIVYMVTLLAIRPPALSDVLSLIPAGLRRRLPFSEIAPP